MWPFMKVTSPRGPADISMRLEIRDAVTGDQIVTVQGLVDGDIENSASIVAVADAKEYFERFDLSLVLMRYKQSSNQMLITNQIA